MFSHSPNFQTTKSHREPQCFLTAPIFQRARIHREPQCFLTAPTSREREYIASRSVFSKLQLPDDQNTSRAAVFPHSPHFHRARIHREPQCFLTAPTSRQPKYIPSRNVFSQPKFPEGENTWRAVMFSHSFNFVTSKIHPEPQCFLTAPTSRGLEYIASRGVFSQLQLPDIQHTS